MIISGGVNIYPQEIEDLFSLHPAVADIAVVGLPDDEMGERVVAFVQPAPGVDRVRAGRRAARLRPRADRPLQGAARDPLPRRAAPHPHRQDGQGPAPRRVRRAECGPSRPGCQARSGPDRLFVACRVGERQPARPVGEPVLAGLGGPLRVAVGSRPGCAVVLLDEVIVSPASRTAVRIWPMPWFHSGSCGARTRRRSRRRSALVPHRRGSLDVGVLDRHQASGRGSPSAQSTGWPSADEEPATRPQHRASTSAQRRRRGRRARDAGEHCEVDPVWAPRRRRHVGRRRVGAAPGVRACSTAEPLKSSPVSAHPGLDREIVSVPMALQVHGAAVADKAGSRNH